MTDEAETTAKMLETLSAKVDELSKALEKKVDEMSKVLKERKEYTEDKIKENPLAYLAGAFTSGLIVGYLMARGKD